MKNLALFVLLTIFISCTDNPECNNCVTCISYDQKNNLINEVTRCNPDTNYLNGYKAGFIFAAQDSGWNAICVNRGFTCE